MFDNTGGWCEEVGEYFGLEIFERPKLGRTAAVGRSVERVHKQVHFLQRQSCLAACSGKSSFSKTMHFLWCITASGMVACKKQSHVQC